MWVVVPIKALACAKQRLAAVLNARQRAELMACMIEDVLAAASTTPDIAGVAVVTADARARQLAAGFGVRCLAEGQDGGLCGALRNATATLAGEGVSSVLILPADIPLVTPSAIARVGRVHAQMSERGAAVTLVAAADGGTNALALSPPDLIAPAFGYNSFRRHCARARALGLYPVALRVRELELDVDHPDDLLALLDQPSQTHAQHYLQASGLAPILRARRPLQGDQTG